LRPIQAVTDWMKVIGFGMPVDGTQSHFDINDLAYCARRIEGFSDLSRIQDKARVDLPGDGQPITELASKLIQIAHDNLVERPWGGDWIKEFKAIAANVDSASAPWGEAFEISAYDLDDEASRFPSRVRLDNGSFIDLPALLKAEGEQLLGADFVGRYGSCFPLLPKTLDVKELLSVQGHPSGHTEVYIIVDSEPGATLRLGFSRDVDAAEMKNALTRGIEQQGALLALLRSDVDARAAQLAVAPWFAERDADISSLSAWLQASVHGRTEPAAALLNDLKDLYWHMLDSMNAIPVKPGQVIYNATPNRLLAGRGGVASAEVHALGNPEGFEILALEIRRPGPTFRAWDNVRFPIRKVDIAAAIDALNLSATRPEEFIVERQPIANRDGAFVSVDCEFFRVEHLMPGSGRQVEVPSSAPQSLHCLSGSVEFTTEDGRVIGSLARGESALVPVGVGAYRVSATLPSEVIRVCLPVS
jgi:mannose-6-phosphate isomerase class I